MDTAKPDILIDIYNNNFPNYLGSWHHFKQLYIQNAHIRVSGVIMGCGLCQIYGVLSLSINNVSKENLYKSLEEFVENGAGAFIATLGEKYYQHEEYLLSVGFKLLSEYPNYRHCESGKYKQRLYILVL